MTTAVFLGTSITEGRGDTGGTANAFPAHAGARLGWTVVNRGAASADYLYGPAETIFRNRIPTVVADDPDVIVVEGGVSSIPELGVSLAAFTAEVPLFFAALAAALPAVPVYVTAPSRQGRTLVDILANAAVLKANAATFGHVYIDWLDPYWITDANADVYVNSDGVHPSAAGNAYLGTRLAHAIRPPSTGLL